MTVVPYTHGPIRDESTHFVADVNSTSGGLGSFTRTLTRQPARGPPNPHLNQLMRAWAVQPTLQLAGLRAI